MWYSKGYIFHKGQPQSQNMPNSCVDRLLWDRLAAEQLTRRMAGQTTRHSDQQVIFPPAVQAQKLRVSIGSGLRHFLPWLSVNGLPPPFEFKPEPILHARRPKHREQLVHLGLMLWIRDASAPRLVKNLMISALLLWDLQGDCVHPMLIQLA